MNPIKWFFLLLVVTSPVGAFADSFTATTASFYFGANYGAGDNVIFSLTGPGVNVGAFGGTPYYSWLGGNPYVGFAPGSVGGGSATVIFDEGMFGTLGPYNPSNSTFNTFGCCTTVYAGTFTFPTNGKNFTVQVPATICCINGTILPLTGPNLPFFVSVPSGSLRVTWSYQTYNGVGLYYFESATFASTPEPASLVLMGTGLLGVLGCARRKFNR